MAFEEADLLDARARHWILDPGDAEILPELRRFDALARRLPRPGEIECEFGIGNRGANLREDAPDRFRRAIVSRFQLEEAIALPRALDQPVGDIVFALALDLIAFDQRDAQFVRASAEQFPQRNALSLRLEIPQADIDERAGAADDAVFICGDGDAAEIGESLA